MVARVNYTFLPPKRKPCSWVVTPSQGSPSSKTTLHNGYCPAPLSKGRKERPRDIVEPTAIWLQQPCFLSSSQTLLPSGGTGQWPSLRRQEFEFIEVSLVWQGPTFHVKPPPPNAFQPSLPICCPFFSFAIEPEIKTSFLEPNCSHVTKFWLMGCKKRYYR